MSLDEIWQHFLQRLAHHPDVINLTKRTIAGLPFLYVTSLLPREEVQMLIAHTAAEAAKGYQLHTECIFVREAEHTYVFRHRFYVPQRKMFCCGNLCTDCIRLA